MVQARNLLSLLSSSSSPLVSLLGDRELDTLALGQRNLGLGALTDDENVGESKHELLATGHHFLLNSPGRERSVEDVSNVNDIEATQMPFPVHDDTGSTHVSAAGDHDNVSGLELDVVDNLVLDKVELDGVVDLDSRVRVSDGSSVVGNDVGDTLGAELVSSDLEELERSLLGGDSVDGESSLDVVEESEVLAGSLNRDDVWDISAMHTHRKQRRRTHEASRVGLVGSDLSVDLDESLLNDRGDLSSSESVLQSVSEEDGEGERLSQLVRTGRRSGSLSVSSLRPSNYSTHVGAAQFVEHP